MNNDLAQQILDMALSAKEASAELALATEEERNGALKAMAQALRDHEEQIIKANEADVEAARAKQTKESLIDRLMLDHSRIEDIAVALESLIELPDPLDVVDMDRTMYNGIELKRVSVPLGVVAMIYEARPNVTADACGICIKSGNSCILRGGSLAEKSNSAIANVLRDAVHEVGLPENCISNVETTDRLATDELMKLHGIIDVIIPRGGEGLIRHCVENSKVPVIETGTGNCHVYLEDSATSEMATPIVLNSKCRRYGVCNAAETLLVDKSAARRLLPDILSGLVAEGVTIHADDEVLEIARDAGIDESFLSVATDVDWATEYLAPDIAIKCVDGVRDAITHINKYGTKHSESIVTENESAADEFVRGVDAAAVYVNAATAFTDGGQFGIGAEIGISTQKLHVRGPFALEALTSYKYVLHGNGQIRA